MPFAYFVTRPDGSFVLDEHIVTLDGIRREMSRRRRYSKGKAFRKACSLGQGAIIEQWRVKGKKWELWESFIVN